MANNNQVTVLVNSCDRYEEAWLPFFVLFKKYWKNCPYSIALNTESKDFMMEGLDITIYHSNNSSWGGRLYETLKKIQTPFVLVFLEDFFFQRPVLTDKFLRCLNCMKEDPSIGVFYFSKITGYKGKDSEYPGFIKMEPTPTYSRYFLNCQAALWRRDVLMTAIEKCSTPWDLEEMKFKDIPEEVKEKKFYCSKTTWYDKLREGDIFSYLLVRETGYGIFKSQWLWNNKKLFEREGIPCKCESLPTLSKRSFLKSKYLGIIKNYL